MSFWVKAAAGGLLVVAALSVAVVPALAFGRYQTRPVWAPPPGMQTMNVEPDPTPFHPQFRIGHRTGHSVNHMFDRQLVSFPTSERSGTIIVDTGHKFLYLVLGDSRALRYGIGTARDGFEWSGVHKVTNKREWPDWTPPAEMIQRQPGIPHHMAGGIDNPLGARALYIGSTLYRIHGTNEPWTIGGDVSSGCIRMTNEDVIDLYGRAKIGAKVIVL
jgi:lipoprotein-anchoring transpeptidase ErfK/SrfK